MHDWHPWAAVAVAVVMELGRTFRDWLKYHYHVIETPARMTNVKIDSKCNEIDNAEMKQVREMVEDNAASIGSMKVDMESDHAAHQSVNSGSH